MVGQQPLQTGIALEPRQAIAFLQAHVDVLQCVDTVADFLVGLADIFEEYRVIRRKKESGLQVRERFVTQFLLRVQHT